MPHRGICPYGADARTRCAGSAYCLVGMVRVGEVIEVMGVGFSRAGKLIDMAPAMR